MVFRNIIGWVGFTFVPIDHLKRILFTFGGWAAFAYGAVLSGRQFCRRPLGRLHLRAFVETAWRELVEHIHDSNNN